MLPVRDSLVEFGNQLRASAGRQVLDTSQLKWETKDLVVVTTVPEFDGVDDGPAPNIRYVGPVLPEQILSVDGRHPGRKLIRGRWC